jgi:hypothetical protein
MGCFEIISMVGEGRGGENLYTKLVLLYFFGRIKTPKPAERSQHV